MTFENSSNERSDVWIATRSHEYMEGTLLVLTYQGHQCLQAKVSIHWHMYVNRTDTRDVYLCDANYATSA